ncbi:MAG TPA: hypothetical protein VGD67_13830 [Pseudonocardiaceae bacterium]
MTGPVVGVADQARVAARGAACAVIEQWARERWPGLPKVSWGLPSDSDDVIGGRVGTAEALAEAAALMGLPAPEMTAWGSERTKGVASGVAVRLFRIADADVFYGRG